MAPRLRTDTRLGQIMVEFGWTASELAVTSNVHHRTLSNYLGGTPMLDEHLFRIADALDVDPEDLLD